MSSISHRLSVSSLLEQGLTASSKSLSLHVTGAIRCLQRQLQLILIHCLSRDIRVASAHYPHNLFRLGVFIHQLRINIGNFVDLDSPHTGRNGMQVPEAKWHVKGLLWHYSHVTVWQDLSVFTMDGRIKNILSSGVCILHLFPQVKGQIEKSWC